MATAAQAKAQNTIVTFGKHNGKTLEEVYQQDWRYLSWLVDQDVTRNGVDYWFLAQDVLEMHDEEDEQQSINRRSY